MKCYALVGTSASGTADKTAVAVIGSTTIRPMVYYISASVADSPADYSVVMRAIQFTASGTGTAQTPQPLLMGDIAAVCTASVAHSAEPTYGTTFMLSVPFNSRGTYQWYAPSGGELIGNLAADDGIGVKMFAASTAVTMTSTVHFRE